MAANLNIFKTSKKENILSKSNFYFAEVHWVIYGITDKKIKILTIWALKGLLNKYLVEHPGFTTAVPCTLYNFRLIICSLSFKFSFQVKMKTLIER